MNRSYAQLVENYVQNIGTTVKSFEYKGTTAVLFSTIRKKAADKTRQTKKRHRKGVKTEWITQIVNIITEIKRS